MLDNIQLFQRALTLTEIVFCLLCVALMITAKSLVVKIGGKQSAPKRSLRIAIIRGICLIAISAVMYTEIPIELSQQYELVTALAIAASVYLCYLCNYITAYFIFKRYGKSRTVGDQVIIIPTYQTRALSLLCSLLFIIVGIVAIVQQLGFSSLLEAGGVIGVIGVMLALTQASWAPDIISGLILLNSDMIEEGDIIKLPNGMIAEVFKTKIFHTELLDIAHNIRIMVRNTTLRDHTLHNLSRYASKLGLRDCLPFNIGYDVAEERVRELFEKVTEAAINNELPFEVESGTDLVLMDTADHALQWGFIFYTKEPERLIELRRRFILLSQQQSSAMGISLATPLTHQANVTNHAFGNSDAQQ